MFAKGLRAYGFDDEAEQLINGQLAGAGQFRESRLPELFGGHARDEVEVPTVYPDSNITQAWTASAMASLVETMLGLRPIAPLGLLLLVRPRLPGWLPWLTIHRLRVGSDAVSLRFERAPDGTTRHEVLAQTGPIEVRFSRSTGCPTASSSLRTIRLRPSWMVSSTIDRSRDVETTRNECTSTGPSTRVTPARTCLTVLLVTTPPTSAT